MKCLIQSLDHNKWSIIPPCVVAVIAVLMTVTVASVSKSSVSLFGTSAIFSNFLRLLSFLNEHNDPHHHRHCQWVGIGGLALQSTFQCVGAPEAALSLPRSQCPQSVASLPQGLTARPLCPAVLERKRMGRMTAKGLALAFSSVPRRPQALGRDLLS